ncbi:non-ribosomal peptide synthase/polyketide synthase [Rhodococcus sp. ACT016]|uniref:non-ribosomal peptide synthase/polyketide synthase n=1 Tax=Rhodococcus sp. ACT016 TaxID=3134808 RepID=UPI003D2D5E86
MRARGRVTVGRKAQGLDSLGVGGLESDNSFGGDTQAQGAQPFPLSPAQLGMWLAQHVDPTVPANIAQYVELHGDLDIARLHRATSRAAGETGSAYVRLLEIDTEPHQVVDASLDDTPVYVDLRGEPDPRAAALAWMRADYSAPVDLLRDRLVVAAVLQVEDDVYFWYNRAHHVVLDGFGATTFVNRVAEWYTAETNGSEPSPGKSSPLEKVYDADRTYRASTRFVSDREYWLERLTGIDETTSLAGRAAPPAALSRIDSAALSVGTAARMDAFLEREDTTTATVVIAAFAAYLAQMTGREDVVLSLPVTGRTTAVLRRSGGMTSNVVPLRLTVSPDTTVSDLLGRVATEVSGALRHQRYRHEDIRRDVTGAAGQASFFGPWVNIMMFHTELRFGDMVGEQHILSTGLIEDLGVNVYQGIAGTSTHVDFESNPNLYGDDEARRNHDRFVEFLDRYAASGSDQPVWEIPLGTDLERRVVLNDWVRTDHRVARRHLAEAFDQQVARTPDATAIVYEGTSLSYAELDARAAGLAHLLIDSGVGPESLVGLSIRRSLDLIVGLNAIVKAGGAWVPIDPDHPVDRTSYILESARPACVLTTARDQVDLPAGTVTIEIDTLDYPGLDTRPVTDADRLAPLRPENTAYVIYTSGSTGRPKGVAVSHAAIDNQLEWMLHEYPMAESDVYLQKTATTFDVSLWGFFMPLRVGASMVVATPDGHRDPVYVANKIAEHAVTVTDFVPSMLTVFVANAPAGSCDSLRDVFVIGEALPPETAADFRKLCGAGLYNLYGPTEAAVSVTYYESGPQDTTTVPIGVAEWNTRAYVLDHRLRPAPIGRPGELYLAGDQLARGYVGRPDITSDRFVANPFGGIDGIGVAGERMYRTGDLVRWRTDGTLDYIGRTDFQVKFRGQRIELGEIETVLLAHDDVSQTVVLVVPTATGDQLVAYVVPAPGRTIVPAELAEFAGRSLPAYMVPASVTVLDAFPLNTSGKLDRKALPEPMFLSNKEFRAPRSDAEKTVAAVYAEVLGIEKVGLDDDFFELGGNSLVATQVVTRVGAALDVRLGVRELFEASTVAALAARAGATAVRGTGTPTLGSVPRPEQVPLSLAQQRMWFLNRFDPTTAVYNLPFAVRLSGTVDPGAFAAAFGDVIERHESLRTIYPEVDGVAQQVVLPAADVVRSLEPVATMQADLDSTLLRLASRGFDVTTEPPFRIELLRLSDSEYVVAMVLHHIAADGSSFGPLARDLMIAYAARAEGAAPAWAPLPVQYADYAVWQHEMLGSESDPNSIAGQQIAYWTRALAGLPDQLDLPADRPRPAVASNAGAKLRFDIPAETHARLQGVAREHGATLFMVVHAAYAVLLSRLSGTSDIAIGTPVAGRGDEALDGLIGMFVNTLVLRAQVDPAISFADLLAAVKETDLEAYGNADVPFEWLVEALEPTRSPARHPLFQAMLSAEVTGVRDLSFAGVRAGAAELDVPISKFDLQLQISEAFDDSGAPAAVAAVFEYATDLFDESTVASFAHRFVRILDAVVADSAVRVGDVEILGPGEIDTLTGVQGDPVEQERLLVDILTAGVAVDPDAAAVGCEGTVLSYRELEERSSRLARELAATGVGPESVVALGFPRSWEMVLAVWAVAKTGAAYVPVDPTYPDDRIAHMLSDSGAVLGITSAADLADLPQATRWHALDALESAARGRASDPVRDADRTSALGLDHVAYVIYTSGSTGRPKGVAVTHRGLAGLVDRTRELYRVGSGDRVLHVCSPSFDPSVLEWALAASAGAELVVVPPTILGGTELHSLLAEQRVTHAVITPAVLGSINPHGLDDLRVVSVGGDASTAELVGRWAPGRQFFNAYGPTETTIVSTRAELFDGRPITIGSPVPGVGALILDTRLRPVPAGVAGELYLTGGALARGYVDRPGLTADRFVASPFGAPGERMYRTGDVVRWTAGASAAAEGASQLAIEYVGRSDFQVKVRGFRIELGEIDAALTDHPDVSFAATVGHRLPSDQIALVSYISAADGVGVAAVSDHVASLLPSYMVPASIIVLDEVPLTPVGKLDRAALPAPVFEAREFRAPTTPIEEIVADVFADVLGVDRVGLDDDFFALGGNSLIATQVMSRLGTALDTRIPVRVLFEVSTVAALAARVEQHAGAGARKELVAAPRPARVPLSLAQQRMWFLNRLDPESPTYNLAFALRLSGVLDVSGLQVAIMDVLDRHESLRTVFPDSPDGPHQVVLDAVQSVPNLLPRDVSREGLRHATLGLAGRGFDVTTEAPVRAELFRLDPTEHVLAIVVHHISADGWSMGPMARDIMTAYAARTQWDQPAWVPLPVQYADYSLWQREILGSEDDPNSVISSQARYWTEHLDGLADQLDLPADRPRPAQQSFRGAHVEFEISPHIHRALVDLAHTQGASLFMIVHAALSVLLSRLAGTRDIAIGTPVAGRGEQALDNLVGMFVNTLVLRTDVEQTARFTEVLAHARDIALGAFAHSDIPFERLVEILNPARSAARHPLVQVMLSFENLGATHLDLHGLTIDKIDLDAAVAKFDLQFTFRETIGEDGLAEGMTGEFTYATDLFDESTVRAFTARFLRVLEAVVGSPDVVVGDIELLATDEAAQLTGPVGPAAPEPMLLADLLAAAADADPDAVALMAETEDVTYRELDERSTRLARLLVSRGAGPEDVIAVALTRSVASVTAVWAVAKSGAAFVPVDPNYPGDRVAHMVSDSGAVLGVTTSEHAASLPDGIPWLVLDDAAVSAAVDEQSPVRLSDTDRVGPLAPTHPAYVIYTSGSTGVPKGVVVTHTGLAAFAAEQLERYGIESGSRTLHFASPSFDASILELLMAFGAGAAMVIAPTSIYGGQELTDLLAARRVTHAFVTPAALASVDPAGLDALGVVVVGGEACSADLVARWATGGRRMFNAYGPTEATVASNISDALVPGEPVTIGRAIRGANTYVLDDRLHPVPAGVVGELYLEGPGLARGYHGRAALTAERFVANPFGEAGSRLYRTGDVVRTSADRVIEYVGRADDQVKLRGFRIELGEIEAVLHRQGTVAHAVVVVQRDQLVAYLVAAEDASIDPAAVKDAVGRALPSYMVPAAVVVLDELPISGSGKLDRQALPEPEFETREFQAPQTRIEAVVADVYADLLGVAQVGRDDDFFELGGNSLIATRVVARVGEALDTSVPVRTLFEASTVRTLAAWIEQVAGAGGRPRLVARPRPDVVPLSYAQQRMWFLNRFDTDSAGNNIPVAVRLSGLLDRTAMRAAVADVIARHESLRTVYPEIDGVGSQVIRPASQVSIALDPIAVTTEELIFALGDLARSTFDVTRDVPLRAALYELSPTEHVLALVVHHIAADGFSMGPLTRDVMVSYTARCEGGIPAWAPLPVQYADYSLWQRKVLGSEDDPDSLLSQQVSYWTDRLAGLPEQIDLPTDRPRPAIASGRGATHRFAVAAQTHQAVVALAQRANMTPFMVVHAALSVLLARLSGTSDIAIGTPVAGRGEAALDDVVGMFVNTLVLRAEVDGGESFADLLTRIREHDLAAFAHADVPFERLVDVLAPTRSQARNPLFQVMLAFQNLGRTSLELPGVTVSEVEFDDVFSKFDLQVTVMEATDANGTAGGLTIELTYATDLFDESSARVFADRFVRVLESATGDPARVVGDVELLGAAERSTLLDTWTATDHAVGGATLVDLFDSQVAATPGAPAVVSAGETVTYGEFASRVRGLARFLISEGVGPESLVAVATARSVEQLVAVHAVLAAGAGYVPVDPDQPVERNTYILETANPVLVLSTSADRAAVPSGVRVVDLDEVDVSGYSDRPIAAGERVSPLHADNPAYVIFTSGSTGRPKGVAVSHRAVVNQLQWMQGEYGLGPADRVLLKTTFTFDASVWELFWPLQVGASIVVASRDAHRDPVEMARAIGEQSVSVVQFVPSVLDVVVEHLDPDRAVSLRRVFCGGEALTSATVERLRRVCGASVHNLYGPTETTVQATRYNVAASDETFGTVPIGAPVWNTRAHVLDARLRPVPVGVPGELYLAGVQLARGYVSRADLTADRFVANPFSTGGDRMYRTGDLVRWNSSGRLEYIGRTDFQVKLRGLRIELGEIETALLALPRITQSAVSVKADQLVAYVVADGSLDLAVVKAELARSLPSYMVPATFVVLDRFPLNASGKLDRRALPEPVFEAREFRAPTTPVEEIVAGVFADLLGVDRVGSDDDFFALGGNSLVATQAVARLGAALDAQVPVRVVFEASTVAALAAKVQQLAGAGARKALTAGPRPDRLPLSLAQQRMWFLNRFEPDSAVNNIPMAIRLTGALDVDALGAALRDVVARHESLRTVFPDVDGVGTQTILPTEQAAIEIVAESATETDLAARIEALASGGFDLTKDVPLRAGLFRLAADQHVLVLVVHHIASDGFSMAPLTRDVMVAYAARSAGELPGWSPLAVQYADYALWQRDVLGAEDDPDSLISKQVSYWTERLSGLPEQLDLPSDRPRPMIASNHGASYRFSIDPELHSAIGSMARAHGATPFMVVHAALSALLARLSGTSDIAIGTPVAGRGEAALDDLIGMFVGTLVLRAEVDGGQSFADLLGQVRATDLAAFEHADLPFERLVEILDPDRSQARHPLFQVMLAFQNLDRASLELAGLNVAVVDFDAAIAKFDLQVTVEPSEHGYSVELTYATDLFDESTMRAFGDRFVRLLESVTSDPAAVVGDVELLDGAERSLVLEGWNATAHAVEGSTLVDVFEAQVLRSPDATALVFEGQSLTYAEFASRAHRTARFLISEGVGPDSLVGLGMRRSLDLLVGMYAVLAAGGGYVPIDPDQPAERNGYILATANPVLLLSTSRDAVDLPETGPVVNLDAVDVSAFSDAPVTDPDRRSPLRPGNAAYVIFTSGSTGRPKGVAVEHAAIVNQVRWLCAEYDLGADDVVLQKTPFTFDVSLWELFGTLAVGGRLVIASPDGHRDPEYLKRVIEEQSVTTTSFVPSMLSAFTAQLAEGDCGTLRAVLVAGEAFPTAAADAFTAVNGAALYNLYGPTEFAVHATARPVAGTVGASVAMGSPVWNSRAYVLDARLRPVPAGVAGELYLAGAQLARGYFGRGDLTADRFVANPFGATGERMYRTGDLVKWTAGASAATGDVTVGELEYLGRTDFQVKLRGLRIELGEIETALLALPRITQSVVLVKNDQLVAYVVAGGSLDVDSVKAELSRSLASYMVPSTFVVLGEFPLNASGKLDRKALPEPVFEAREFRAPATPVEEIVAGVFAEVLDLDRVGRGDDFFALGGNSLIATQVVSRLGAALDARVPVRDLFEASTVEALAARLSVHAGGGRQALVARTRPERIPLSLAQQRMWFLNRFDTESTAYNIPMALRLSGDLDVAALERAIADVTARHESLRTVFPATDDGPEQVILPADRAVVELEAIDVEPAEVADRLRALAATRFDVTADVPIGVELYRTGVGEFVLGMVVHHISADGVSLAPLTRDVMTAYAARATGHAPGWAPLTVQYADYALWQREVLGDENDPASLSAQQLSYWADTLADLPDQLNLPADHPRPAVQSFRGGLVEFEIDAATHRGLRDLARGQNATLFMAVHSAFAVLLSRLSGSDDIAVGTPIAGRGEALLDDLVGMFVNTLVFRTRIDGDRSFADTLAAVREGDLQAFANADVPFERLVEVLNPTRSTARHPLFQVGFSFQNHDRGTFELPGLTVDAAEVESGVAQFDLHLIVEDHYDDSGDPVGMKASMTYAADLFDEPTVQSFADRFARLLSTVVVKPAVPVGDVDLLGVDERAELLAGRNATDRHVESATLVDLFDAQVAATPDAVALVSGDERLTYFELDARVNRLARHLVGLGVGPESSVALAIRRSVDLLVAMYAVAKTGGAYLPVDPDQPAERTGYILDAAEPVCVLTTSQAGFTADQWPVLEIDTLDLGALSGAPITDAERLRPLRPENTAYVIFTSGSTGRPKGVAVPHGAIVNQLRWMRDEYDLGVSDAALLKTAATFDLSVWEFWSMPTSGGRLVIAAPDGHRDPGYLLQVLHDEQVTAFHVVPSMLSMLLTTGALPSSLRHVFAIGEALPATTAQTFRERSTATLHNLYGPTEAAVSVTHHEVTADDTAVVPIGVPEWNTQVYVLDSRLNPVPAGVTGELYLAGAQLARGYFGRADLTADRFVANPWSSGERMYRTGDVVRWTIRASEATGYVTAGELEYVERADFQVKVRGFRIELGEIEAALRDLTAVAAAAVTAHSDDRTGDRLVAYVVPAADAPDALDTEQVRVELARTLPSYMVPSAFVVLEALPLNANGKLDRKALPAPVFEAREFRAATTPLEEIVAGAFADVLGVERVGVDDDFFELGGNSLVATQLVARLGAALDTQVPVRVVFEDSTVAGVVAAVTPLVGRGARAPLTARPRPDLVPLSLAQQRMWTLNQVDPASAAYNIPVAVRLSGALDVDVLRDAVADVIGRHEVLRTMYPDSVNGPVQQVVPVDQAVPRLDSIAVTEAEIVDRLTEFVGRGFDVTTEVPVRAALYAIGNDEHMLAFVAHHVSADGFSMGPLIRDVMLAYVTRVDGGVPQWQPLTVQYADFSLWQREVLGTESDPESVVARQIAYWADALKNAPELSALPTDRPRPARPSMAGASVDIDIDAELAARVENTAREQGATTFMVFHAALAVLLSRLGGSNDVTIGTPVAGRGEAALDDLIGMFVNTLALRTRVEPSSSFGDLLAHARTQDLAAFGNADVPFEQVVDAAGVRRSSAYTPLFQVMLTFQNMDTGTFALPGLEVSALDLGGDQAKFDLQLTAVEQFDADGALTGVRAMFTYATDLFDRDTVAAFGERFVRILDAVTDDPAIVLRAIDVTTDAEREALAPKKELTVDDLPELVAGAARVAPDTVAVSHGGTDVTFGELHAKLDATATATGGALKAEALMTVALSGLLPGILPALGADGYGAAIATLIADASAIAEGGIV